MFIHQTRLPHVLAPRLYSCPEQYRREVERLFLPAWHCIGSADTLARDGDFLTLQWLGKPLLVRNFGGELHAFLNVCTHRHCTLRSEPRGTMPALTCQYHGWEYDLQGCTKHIPDARSFKPLPGGPERLQRFRAEKRGPLVFVSLDDAGPKLDDFLGPLAGVCDEFPAARWRQAGCWEYVFPCNWKIPVENTIESYHVPIIHPTIFGNFPAEEDTTHEIHKHATVMRAPSALPGGYRRLAEAIVARLEPGAVVDRYSLHHGFPHLFLIRIDAMLQVMTVAPLAPGSCRLTVQVFALRAARENPLTRLLTRFWGGLKVHIVRRVLAEDAPLYPALQQGMESSPFRGTISIREELIFAFQDYIRQRCGLPSEEASSLQTPS